MVVFELKENGPLYNFFILRPGSGRGKGERAFPGVSLDLILIPGSVSTETG
jgi:hypothetical protein